MELVSLLLIVLFAWMFLKLFGLLFHTAAFMLVLPLKLLAVGLATLLVVFVFVPLGIVAAIAGVVLAPLAILLPLLPFLLIGFGVYLVAKNAR